MRAVNLLPRETRSSRSAARRFDPMLAGGAALTVAVVAGVGAGFFLAHSHASSEQKKLASARSELAILQAAARKSSGGSTPVLPTPMVTAEQGPWQTALASALQTRVPWDNVLYQLAHVVPANVTISTVNLGGGTLPTSSSSGSSTTTPPPATTSGTSSSSSFQIGGTAFSEQSVAQLLSRLALIPDLNNVVLSTSSADPKSGHVTFTISAQVAIPAIPVTALGAGGTS